ncbi:hypothetical protein Q7P37_010360 [Cladosporium fusiforme]
MRPLSYQPEYQHLPGPVGDILKGTYSTTASIPITPSASLVYTTGHLGLDLSTGILVRSSLEAEFEAIFECLDAALKHANIRRGCEQAFRFTSYLTSPEYEITMQQVFKRKWPGHQPTWVAVVVSQLVGGPGMHAEIAAEAVSYGDA